MDPGYIWRVKPIASLMISNMGVGNAKENRVVHAFYICGLVSSVEEDSVYYMRTCTLSWWKECRVGIPKTHFHIFFKI